MPKTNPTMMSALARFAAGVEKEAGVPCSMLEAQAHPGHWHFRAIAGGEEFRSILHREGASRAAPEDTQ